MATPGKVQLHDNSNAKSSHNAPTDLRMRSSPCLYTFAIVHIRKTLPSYFRGQDKSSEVLGVMRTLLPENKFRRDFWKWLLIQRLPLRIQSRVMDNLHNYTGDQLSHMADIVYERIYGCQDYCLYATDQASGANFLIGTGYSRSTIPLKLYERIIGDPVEYLKESQDKDMAAYGMMEMIVNFSLGRFLRWNFYVTDVPTPVIGADFLSYYNLVVDLKSRKLIDNQFKPTLFDPDHEDDTMCYQWSEVETVLNKMVSHLQGHESPSEILDLMRRFVSWEALHDVVWKQFFLSMLIQSLQTVLQNKIHSHTISELAFQADCIYEESHLKMNNRLYVTDPISRLTFLIDSGSHLSQIPSDEMSTPIPFSRIVTPNGFDLIEYGQKSITLDLGLNERLTWNFVMTNTRIPIIGADFLTYYELLIDLRRRRLMKNRLS